VGSKSTAGEPPEGKDPAEKGFLPKRNNVRTCFVGYWENIPVTVTADAVERYRFLFACCQAARAQRSGRLNLFWRTGK
jgi:hypothetical protein